MLPEISFGVLLLGFMGGAFYTGHRNLVEQQRTITSKNNLVANLAHELKTPIATVSAALEGIADFGHDRKEYLAIGRAELGRLDQMADRAIETMRAGGLETALALVPCRIDRAVLACWQSLSLRYHLPEERLRFSLHTDPELNADVHYLHHLVYNLIDNACKHGGVADSIEVVLTGTDDWVVLQINDRGPGIPTGEQERIFDRFYRVERPGEGHRVKGNGLGLSFVRQIARAHGGSVRADNRPGGGAVLTVELPRRG